MPEKMQIAEVTDKKTKEEFLRVPKIIYKDDKNWIPHLETDIKAVFDPEKNQQFNNGTLKRWILKDQNGRLVGRIAAFVNNDIAYSYKQPTGGFGFFECINDRDAAFLLFDTAKKWLSKVGMEAMDGPINFGEKDRYWGLLVDGHNKETPYLMSYNPPYYKSFFEEYGFKIYYEQYVYRIYAGTALPPVMERKFQRVNENQGYHFEHLKLKHIDKYAKDFMTIYNKAWSNAHENFQPMTEENAIQTFRKMRHVVKEELVFFAYHNNEPVAFFVSMLEINQILKHLNGQMDLWGKIRFLYYKWRGVCRDIYGIVFGVIPEYQNRGLESGLIMSLRNKIIPKKYYKSMLIAWIGDFNPKMIKLMEHIGAKREFTLITCRKLFDDAKTFERHPVIN